MLGRTPFGSSGNGHAHGLLRLFPWIEHLMARGRTIELIEPGSMLRCEIAPLPRGILPLAGRPPVRQGEPVIVIHFDNAVMTALGRSAGGEAALARMVVSRTRADLRALARRVERGEFPAGIRAIWAETLIYTAMELLGFHVRPAPPTLRAWGARLFLLALMAVYRADGLDHLLSGRSQHYTLGEAWMSVEELLRHYGSANTAQRPDHHPAGRRNDTGTDKERPVAD